MYYYNWQHSGSSIGIKSFKPIQTTIYISFKSSKFSLCVEQLCIRVNQHSILNTQNSLCIRIKNIYQYLTIWHSFKIHTTVLLLCGSISNKSFKPVSNYVFNQFYSSWSSVCIEQMCIVTAITQIKQ